MTKHATKSSAKPPCSSKARVRKDPGLYARGAAKPLRYRSGVPCGSQELARRTEAIAQSVLTELLRLARIEAGSRRTIKSRDWQAAAASFGIDSA